MISVIQPSVPISVVASGIMIRTRKNIRKRPSERVYRPNAGHDGHADADEQVFLPGLDFPAVAKKSINCKATRKPTIIAPRMPNSESMSRNETPDATRSCSGNWHVSSITK